MKGVIIVDVKKCVGCKSCEIECAIAHSKSKTLIGAVEERSIPRLKVEEISKNPIPIRCAHCEMPVCISVCPSGAIEKTPEGAIVINQDLCVGWRSCIIACPYGIPEVRSDGKAVIKCDYCFERLKKGEKVACVSACPTGAIKFIEIV